MPAFGQVAALLPNTVRALRQAAGLSQQALADKLDVSRQTINSIETGRYTPTLPLALDLAAFFETTVEEVFAPHVSTSPAPQP